MKDVTILVAALADSEFMAPGSTFEYTCTRCSRRVMLAPSGQRFLRRNAAALVLCTTCFATFARQHPDVVNGAEHILSGSPDEVAKEVQSAIPNLRRTRN